MLVPFNDLSPNSRVWIYPSSRKFTETDIKWVEEQLRSFLQQWTAHGNDLKASFLLPYQRFIVIALDPSDQDATGCSIDASVRFIQQIEQKCSLILLDKMNVSFKQGEFVTYKTIQEFKKMVKNKSVSENTIVFNHLVLNKADFEHHWEVPAHESWHKRFF